MYIQLKPHRYYKQAYSPETKALFSHEEYLKTLQNTCLRDQDHKPD